MRLGQDHFAGSFEVTKEALTISGRNTLGLLQQFPSSLKRIDLAAFLVGHAALGIELGGFATEFLNGLLGFDFKARLTAV